VHEAQRVGFRNRLRDQWHVPEIRADALIDAWEEEAATRSLSADAATYWSDGEAWIRAHAGASHDGARPDA
jgi:hypothetical protein